MQDQVIPPEVQFLSSPFGGFLVVVTSFLSFAILWLWVRQPGHEERWSVFYASVGSAIVLTIVSAVAIWAGWWQGAFFTIPLWVQAAIDLPLATVGWALWLTQYRWLQGHTRHALLAYAVLVLSFIPITFIADMVSMGRGQFSLGGGYTVWHDVIIGQVVLWAPVGLYEAIRRRSEGNTKRAKR